jgi:hypothetical protein
MLPTIDSNDMYVYNCLRYGDLGRAERPLRREDESDVSRSIQTQSVCRRDSQLLYSPHTLTAYSLSIDVEEESGNTYQLDRLSFCNHGHTPKGLFFKSNKPRLACQASICEIPHNHATLVLVSGGLQPTFPRSVAPGVTALWISDMEMTEDRLWNLDKSTAKELIEAALVTRRL